jgi:thiol-disulfide isomerase/thioredoxin
MKNKFLSSIAFWQILVLILFIACVALGVMLYQKQALDVNDACPTDQIDVGIGSQAAAEKAMKYINQYLIGDGSGVFSSVEEQPTSFYKFKFNYGEKEWGSFVSSDGKYVIPSDTYEIPALVDNETKTVEGNFTEIVGAEVCKENEKPTIYFFGSTTCPHCEWEKPIVQEVVAKFGDLISYHENVDNQNDADIFSKYSATGSIPAIVIGCQYYRIGSGEGAGEDSEKQTLTKLICNLTGNQPESICN